MHGAFFPAAVGRCLDESAEIMKRERVGICGWTLDRGDALASVEQAAARGFSAVQVGFFTAEAVRGADPAKIVALAERLGVRIVSVFAAFEREDFSSIAHVAANGGYMSDDEWDHRFEMTREVGDIATRLGCPSIAVHAGTVPVDAASADRAKLRDRTRRVADRLAELNLRLLLETGRESAGDLRGFIDSVGATNVGVNFDPGNFVVYGADDPVRAVMTLKGLIDIVHVKDAKASSKPGTEFGSPATLGSGDANIPRVLSKLRIAGFDGPLLVEENTRVFGVAAIPAAADYLRSMLD